jgi:hypothetical protein
MLATISASQDVIYMTQAVEENPEHRRSRNRLEQAKNHLNQKWQSLTSAIEETSLVTD